MRREPGMGGDRWIRIAATILGLAAVSVAVAAPGGRPSRLGPGSRNIESVSVEDVAPEDRQSRADQPRSPGSLPRAGEDIQPLGEREQLAALGDEISRLWRAIPTYSPVFASSRLTSGFGWRRGPFSGKREFHGGVDLAAARGTAVVAPADGIVEAVFVDEASGRVVVLDHGNGMETLYGHLDAALVRPGQDVQRGTAIGRIGTTGWRSTGPHLHYAIRVGKKYTDPRRYLFERGGNARKRPG